MLRIPNNHCLLFPLRGHEFVTVFCQLASIVYLFGHLRGRQIKREEKCDEGGVGGGCWEIRDGDAGRFVAVLSLDAAQGCGASVLLSGPNDEHSVGADTTLSHGRAGPRHPRQGRASTTDPNCAYKVSCADILALAVRDVIS
ncbi:hypothetical protein BDA96_06G044400 [Sorghum bicolor]|uniref:Plant heme peroxidase family profile domain-containing protein n=2 Tax=Sorghum bicolor TaxID=4558 RepID=C6JRP0_SORBI|nr:hypothetical protein BDA96_06G044400 [Sorghum bicolor]OQU79027.1 hypothetical protein SORBI_3008G088845 [Sorghum bicolor]